MALSAGTYWYIRFGAGVSNSNGGGFDPTVASPGTNYADQDAAQGTGTNLTVDATTNTDVAPDGYSVTSADVGNIVRISTNTGGWTRGYYTITSIASGKWRLDRSPAAVGTASGAWSMGGAFATPGALASGGSAADVAAFTGCAAGHTIWIRGAGTDTPSSVDYTWTSGYYTLPAGSRSVGRILVIGYNGRPLIGFMGLLFFSCTLVTFVNLAGKVTTVTYSTYGFVGADTACAARNLRLDQNGNDVQLLGCNAAIDCYLFNSGATTAGTNPALDADVGYAAAYYRHNVFRNIRGYAIDFSTGYSRGVFAENLILGCKATTKAAIEVGCSSDGPHWIFGNTINGGAAEGMNFQSLDAICTTTVQNNIISNNAGVGIKCPSGTAANDRAVVQRWGYNNLYNNNSGGAQYTNLTAPSTDRSADPSYTNAAGDDYSVGTGEKAQGYPSGVLRGSSTYTYVDPGAAQRQETGSSGPVARRLLVTNIGTY